MTAERCEAAAVYDKRLVLTRWRLGRVIGRMDGAEIDQARITTAYKVSAILYAR